MTIRVCVSSLWRVVMCCLFWTYRLNRRKSHSLPVFTESLLSQVCTLTGILSSQVLYDELDFYLSPLCVDDMILQIWKKLRTFIAFSVTTGILKISSNTLECKIKCFKAPVGFGPAYLKLPWLGRKSVSACVPAFSKIVCPTYKI